MRLLMLCAGLVAVLAGCTHMGTQYNSYQPIPAKSPKITFVRNQNRAGSSVVTTITINDWIVGTLAPGEYVTLEHPPGQHSVRVKGKTIPLTFKNNREYFFLIEQDPSGNIKAIRPIYAQEAAKYMDAANYHSSR